MVSTDLKQPAELPHSKQPTREQQRWMFVVCALNRPGTLTAAAAVFSNRGISLEGFLGSGIDTSTEEDGRLLFSFRATPQKQALLKRSLQRLPSIFNVDAYTYDDPKLRAIAIAKLVPTADVDTTSAVHTEIVVRNDTSYLLMLTGSTTAVESAIAHLRQQQQIQDVVMSAITV
ncbi:MAG: hypothetical protein AAFY72_16655 [Cyanobacteria bacterium J06649_4]